MALGGKRADCRLGRMAAHVSHTGPSRRLGNGAGSETLCVLGNHRVWCSQHREGPCGWNQHAGTCLGAGARYSASFVFLLPLASISYNMSAPNRSFGGILFCFFLLSFPFLSFSFPPFPFFILVTKAWIKVWKINT